MNGLKLSAISLAFRDPRLEQEFLKRYESELRTTLPLAVTMSLVSWALGLILTWFVIPELFLHFLIILVIGIFIPFLGLIYATKQGIWMGKYHLISAGCNLWSGVLLIYFCRYFPYGTDMMMMLLIFMVFVGFYSYRLLLVSGTLACFLYLLCFQIYIIYFIELESAHTIILSFVSWLTLVFAVFAGYATEKNSRLIFIQRRRISIQKEIIDKARQDSERLLLNILPFDVAQELKITGKTTPKKYEEVTVMFTDFKDFTSIVEKISSELLIHELNDIFTFFDEVMENEGIEKIETIGDAYLAVCGLPSPVSGHAIRCISASKKILSFLKDRNIDSEIVWNVRIGIHSGPITAGVVGKKKFAYDVYGDTVNIASRLQTAGIEGKINISASTYNLVRHNFNCEYRGTIPVKGKGYLDMYLVD